MNLPRPNDDWKPCPQGVVSNMLSRQKSMIRRSQRRRVAWVGLALLALLPVVGVISQRFDRPLPSSPPQQQVRLACREVLALRRDYLSGSVSSELREAIERHLEKCPHCARQYRTTPIGTAPADGTAQPK